MCLVEISKVFRGLIERGRGGGGGGGLSSIASLWLRVNPWGLGSPRSSASRTDLRASPAFSPNSETTFKKRKLQICLGSAGAGNFRCVDYFGRLQPLMTTPENLQILILLCENEA